MNDGKVDPFSSGIFHAQEAGWHYRLPRIAGAKELEHRMASISLLLSYNCAVDTTTAPRKIHHTKRLVAANGSGGHVVIARTSNV